MVALLTLATVSTGFLLQIFVLRMAGASSDADAYFATAAIPQVILSIAAYIVTGSLMPQLARLDEETRSAVARTILLLILGIGIPLATGLYLTASLWTFLIFPGFANGNAPASSALAGLAALTMPFAVATCVMSAQLYAERRFLTNEFIVLGTTVALACAAFLVIPGYGIISLGWLVLGRFIIQLGLQSLCISFSGEGAGWSTLKPILRQARPLLAGALYFKSDLLVDRYLLSLALPGTLSIVVFGQSIFVAASGVLGQALANTASPTLAVAHNTGDAGLFRSVLRKNLVLLLAASGFLVIFSVAFVPPIASLLTKRAVADGAINLRLVLFLFAGLPVGACVGSLLANAFYAMGDARTPTIMSAITFTIFLGAKIFVFAHFGLYAFCALTSVYYLSNGGIMAILLRRRMHKEFPV